MLGLRRVPLHLLDLNLGIYSAKAEEGKGTQASSSLSGAFCIVNTRLQVGSNVASQELTFPCTHGTTELAVKAKNSPETRPPLPPQEGKSAAMVSRVWVGGGEAALDAAWVGETRCELQLHPQLSCGCLPRVLGTRSAAPCHHSHRPRPHPLSALCWFRSREGRTEGSPRGQQAGDPKLVSLFSHHPRAVD